MFGSLLCRNTTHCFAIPGAFYVDNLYIVSNIQADSIQHITKSFAEFLNVWFTPLSQYNPLFCDSRCVHVDNLYIMSNIQADSIQYITKSIAEFLNVWFTPLLQHNPLFCDSR